MVEAGVNGTPFVTPPLHAYEVAPPPVNVTLLLLHTEDDDVFAVTVGNGLTVNVNVEFFGHPLLSVTVNV